MGATSQRTSALSGRVAIFSALAYRNYRLFWTGQMGSVLAQYMEIVAQGWLVLQLTNSPLMLGLTGLAHAIPTILLTLLGGVIADRTDRRRIMLVAQAAAAGLFFTLATLITTERVLVWHIMVLAFVSGCLKAFDRPSRYALLTQMVPREEIANAVALGSAVWQLNRLVGPSVAGMLIYLYGVGVTYYACFFSSLIALCLWLQIRTDQPKVEGSGIGLLKHMLDGLSFIVRNELFYTLIGMTFFNSVFGMSYVILMPVFARDILHVGSRGFGFLQTTTGVGAFAGTLVVAYLGSVR